IEEPLLHTLGLVSIFLLFLLRRHLTIPLALVLLILILIAALTLPRDWLLLPAWWALGLVPFVLLRSPILARWRSLFSLALLLLAIALPCTACAYPDAEPVLVYFLPKEPGKAADARAIVPAQFWSQLQTLASQPVAGAPAYWVEQVRCQ